MVGPTVPLVGAPWFALSERNSPGSIIVNMTGKRFMNESMPYVEACHRMYGGTYGQGPVPGENIPAWLVFDQQYRDRYIFAGLQPGQRIPKKWLESGVIVKADTLEELATRAGLPVDQLTATVEQFNAFARTGVDDDFHRGEISHAVLRRQDGAGRPGHQGRYPHRYPWPRAARRRFGDRRVVRGGQRQRTGDGTYLSWPGGTIGPAMTFGYLAALHIAGKS